MNIRNISFFAIIFLLCASCTQQKKIDRYALVTRNNPHVTSFDTLSSLSVGNGSFAMTVDATGLQTFPELYSKGVPLGTQSNRGWHSFPNVNDYRFEETLESYNFGRNHDEIYAVQFRDRNRRQDAANYFRVNPHRLHLGTVGLELSNDAGLHLQPDDIKNIQQELDMWNGRISSSFYVDDNHVQVSTVCHPNHDVIACKVESPLISKNRLGIKFRFPYPTGAHTDDACDWTQPSKHETKIADQGNGYVLFERHIDGTSYFVKVSWKGNAAIKEKEPHYFVLESPENILLFTVDFMPQSKTGASEFYDVIVPQTQVYWQQFWQEGAVVDFSLCKDTRAKELERRIVLSQYLMAIQCAASEPPQETGLTYNSWYGKYHLEMHWWHGVHFALWNRLDLLERSMDWYATVEPVAKGIAERQGFDGIRWMKMTDPSGLEAPSSIGSFLIWQQPHYIYMAELIYRQKQSPQVIEKYKDLVFKTADFMASYTVWDAVTNRYIIKGFIPAQETLHAAETYNAPFELSYWHYALSVAQKWRERAGMERNVKWDDIIEKLSPLAAKNGLYLAAESAPQTYEDVRFTSDHMAVLGAWGILPQSRLVEPAIMKHTFNWVWDNWKWDRTWGWDYPMTAMCAARTGEPEKAVSALLMDKRTNTYLVNGHNYKDQQLRIYLPGNGGLLTAIAMMCAGWDGNTVPTPGFPKDGNWDVRWEGLLPMP